MDGLKGAVKGCGGAVAIFKCHIQDLAALQQANRRKGHAPTPDVLRQRHTGEIGEHPLKMVGGTADYAGKVLIVRRAAKVVLNLRER